MFFFAGKSPCIFAVGGGHHSQKQHRKTEEKLYFVVKGTVSRDFMTLVFFIISVPQAPDRYR
jgi:hypothetical protein